MPKITLYSIQTDCARLPPEICLHCPEIFLECPRSRGLDCLAQYGVISAYLPYIKPMNCWAYGCKKHAYIGDIFCKQHIPFTRIYCLHPHCKIPLPRSYGTKYWCDECGPAACFTCGRTDCMWDRKSGCCPLC